MLPMKRFIILMLSAEILFLLDLLIPTLATRPFLLARARAGGRWYTRRV